MPGAGRLDRRITIQRSSATTNDFNEQVAAFADLFTVWARRLDAADAEAMAAAGQVGSFRRSRFVVRSSNNTRSITPKDRIRYGGTADAPHHWNIEGVKETGEGRRRYLEITAVRDADS